MYAMALVVWELLTLKRPFHEFQEHMLPGLVGWGAQVLRGLAGARRRIFFVFCARAQQSRAPAAASQQLRPPGAAGCFGLQPGRWCAAGQSTLPARPASASDRSLLQRPGMSELLEVAEAKKDAAEGAALPMLVRAVEVRASMGSVFACVAVLSCLHTCIRWACGGCEDSAAACQGLHGCACA